MRNRVFIVPRLDRDTPGVLIFAKSEEAKIYLPDCWQEFSKKCIVSVVRGKISKLSGTSFKEWGFSIGAGLPVSENKDTLSIVHHYNQ